jgi:hypothetical protein
VLRVGWCTVLRGSPEGLHLVVGSSGAPETQPDSAPWLPIEHAEALEANADWVPQVWRDMDTTLVAAPLGEAHTAVMLGRPGGPAFRPSEVARLGYLAGIVATMLALSYPSGPVDLASARSRAARAAGECSK